MRLVRAGTASAVLASALLCGPAPVAAAAGTPGYCPDANGVTVVVDFHELGGSTIVRCAPGDQPTGLAALQNAGFTVTGTARWGLAFVCRINGKPGDAECIDTPPTSAYWSYWYAPDGGAWRYSDKGATSRKPPLGSFEGWSFSLNRTTPPPPRIAPSRPAPPPAPPVTQNPPAQQPPAQQPPTQRPPASDGSATAPGAAEGPAAGSAGAGTAPGVTPPSSGAASTSTGGSPAGVGPGSGEGDGDKDGEWTGDVDEAAQQGSGSPIGLLAGGAVILLLGAAAAVVTLRRRASGRS